LARLKIIVAEWFEWLEQREEQVHPETMDFEIEVAEMLMVGYNPAKVGKPELLFWSEVLPIAPRDITRSLRLVKHSPIAC